MKEGRGKWFYGEGSTDSALCIAGSSVFYISNQALDDTYISGSRYWTFAYRITSAIPFCLDSECNG